MLNDQPAWLPIVRRRLSQVVLTTAIAFTGWLCAPSQLAAQIPAQHPVQKHQPPQRTPMYVPNNMIPTGHAGQGSSSQQFKDQAMRQIPLQQVMPEFRGRVREVINKTSVYRRLPVTTIHTDPDLYLFTVRYPETMLNIWQLMGVTQMTAERVAPFRLNFDDGVGTAGHVDLIYGTPNLNIYYGEGIYEGPMLFRKVAGQCVLVLHTQYHRDATGRPQTTSQLDVFLKIDHLTASLIAKTVHPLIGSTADSNFVESLRFLQKLSETTETNGHGVTNLSRRMTNVRPDVRQRFENVVEIVAQRAQASPAQVPSAAHQSTQQTSPGTLPGGRHYPNQPTSYRPGR